jgi:hypothetical protein
VQVVEKGVSLQVVKLKGVMALLLVGLEVLWLVGKMRRLRRISMLGLCISGT